MRITDVAVTDLAARVRSGELGARELMEVCLRRIDEVNPAINAFVAVDGDRAMAEAAEIDELRARGEEVGALAGIPIGVKDLEHATGFVTSYGSALHTGDAPATADSTLVARLRDAGCIVVGKTNTPEHGWQADTRNVPFGTTVNPFDHGRSAGGSSGGSAAAVAAGMVPLCTGSDGGGSIRIPSALCGLSSLKPSLGRVPDGSTEPPGWQHLSTRGPMAMRIRDVAYVLDAVVGPDPRDLRSLPMPEASWTRGLAELHPPRHVGWSPTLGYASVDAEILAICQSLVDKLAARGTEVLDVPSVFDTDPVFDWLAIANTCNLRTLGKHRGTDAWDRIDPGLRAAIEWAEGSVSAVRYIEAVDAGHRLNSRLVDVLHGCSLLLTPLAAGQTPAPGEVGTIDGQPNPNWIGFTYPFNMTGSPAGTVTAGYTAAGMPVGLQVIGPRHGDAAVLRLLAVLEDLADAQRTPG